jgi:hypothetical protein
MRVFRVACVVNPTYGKPATLAFPARAMETWGLDGLCHVHAALCASQLTSLKCVDNVPGA